MELFANEQLSSSTTKSSLTDEAKRNKLKLILLLLGCIMVGTNILNLTSAVPAQTPVAHCPYQKITVGDEDQASMMLCYGINGPTIELRRAAAPWPEVSGLDLTPNQFRQLFYNCNTEIIRNITNDLNYIPI